MCPCENLNCQAILSGIVSSQIHIHPVPGNVTLFENSVFADAVSSDEVTLDEGGSQIQGLLSLQEGHVKTQPHREKSSYDLWGRVQL